MTPRQGAGTLSDDLLLLSSLLRQGMPVERAASKLGQGWTVDPDLAKVLASRLPSGAATALAASPDVPGALQRAAAIADGRQRLARRVRAATFYPILLVTAFLLLGTFLTWFSTVADTFYGTAKLPALTRRTLLLMHNLPFAMVLALLAVPFMRQEAFLLRVPGFGAAMRDTDGELFFESFRQVVGSLALPEALRLASRACVLSRIRQEFEAAADAVERGDSLRASLRKARWIPPIVTVLLGVAEERQFKPQILADGAGLLARESELRAVTQLYFLTPLVTLTVAGGMLWFAAAFLLPIYGVAAL